MKLRKILYKDIPFILEWMKDSNINKYFRFNPDNINEDSIRKFIDESNGDSFNFHYAITEDDDEYLGTISLKNINNIDKNAEYAIALRNKSIGTQIASVATKEILRIGFDDLKLAKVYLNVLSYNKRAIAFYEKMGFKYEGEFKNHVMIRQNLENLKWYAYYRGDENFV